MQGQLDAMESEQRPWIQPNREWAHMVDLDAR